MKKTLIDLSWSHNYESAQKRPKKAHAGGGRKLMVADNRRVYPINFLLMLLGLSRMAYMYV